jgi:glucose-1-phosphate adenylyltransferase
MPVHLKRLVLRREANMAPIQSPHQLVRRSVALVLAGGRGARLKQLTDLRAKPAVYFGGKFRIIDFALSNCVNSGIRRIGVVTQYKSHSLLRHIQRGWSFLRAELGEFGRPAAGAAARRRGALVPGTADAVYQNLDIIRRPHRARLHRGAGRRPCLQDGLQPMLADHVESGRLHVGCIEVPRAEASAFGVMAVDRTRRITAFVEKPADPPALPGRAGHQLASMGIYVFNAEYLYRLLDEDLANPQSSHDFGKDVIPKAVAEGRAQAHPFAMSCIRNPNGAPPYWRDVGTLDAYWAANLDLAAISPELDIYDQNWPIWTYQRQLPPAKFIPDVGGAHGMAANTLVSAGCIVSGSQVSNAVLFSNVRIRSFCNIQQAVLLPGVVVGRGARLKRVVVDRACEIPERLVVGEDAQLDAQRFERTEQGVVLITRPMLARL